MGSPGLGGVNATFDTGSNGGIIRAGGTTLNLGALTGAAGTRVEAQTSAGPASDTISIGGKNVDATFNGIIADGINANPRPASVTKVGTGIQTLAGVNTFSGTTTVNAGVLRVTGSIAQSSGVTVNAGGVFDAAGTQMIKGLTVNAGGTARVSAGGGPGPTVLRTVALTLTDSGALDVGTHAVIVDYTTDGGGVSPLPAIRAAVAAGAAPPPGPENTPVIRSSAPGDSGGVGYAEASDVLGATGGAFLGQEVDGDAVLIRYTLKGDASLNGVVDFDDLARLAQNYNVVDGTMTWSKGDFNHDGNVNFDDLAAMAQNYNQSLPAPALGGFSAEFRADAQAAFANVPEPAALGVLTLGAMVFRRRRRERS
jgi:autotransporter-associated beta strand protein